MAMQPLTINDILNSTSEYHAALAASLRNHAEQSDCERGSLLLNYLSDKERELANAVGKIRQALLEKTSNTWCYQYTDRHPILHSNPQHLHFSDMSTEEIQQTITNIHDQLMDLYAHICERAETNTVSFDMQNIIGYYRAYTRHISSTAATVHVL